MLGGLRLFHLGIENVASQLDLTYSGVRIMRPFSLLDCLTLEIFLENSWMDNRGLYALYTPTTSIILVVVVNPFNNREIAIAQLERQFRDAVRNQSQSNVDTSELACKVRMAELKSECITKYQYR